MVIWPLTWLVELWKVPRKTPLLAYINQELTTIKRNCLDRTPVASDCLSLVEGLRWRTAGSLFLGAPQLYWGKFHCLSLSVERPLQETWPPLEVRTAGKCCLWLGSHMLSKNLQVLILKRRGSRAQNVACCTCFIWNFIIKKLAFVSQNFVSLRFEFWKLVAFFRANENSRIVKYLYWLKSTDTLRYVFELKKPGKAGM